MNPAELILNPDGSVYHLNLLPDDVAPTIILVGDQDRVPMVSAHFDRIELKKQKREFNTHTGWIGSKRLTVMSTGIGTDNIDIALNELDALFNIDLVSRTPKEPLTELTLIRIGTSGSIHPDVPVDSVVLSTLAVGLDVLGAYYDSTKSNHRSLPPWSYICSRTNFDLSSFPLAFKEGITLTNPGFYGPQGRVLRIVPGFTIPIDDLYKEQFNDLPFTNLEMETSGIYLLADLLGHRAISFNAILANRLHGNFSVNPNEVITKLIQAVITWIGQEGSLHS